MVFERDYLRCSRYHRRLPVVSAGEAGGASTTCFFISPPAVFHGFRTRRRLPPLIGALGARPKSNAVGSFELLTFAPAGDITIDALCCANRTKARPCWLFSSWPETRLGSTDPRWTFHAFTSPPAKRVCFHAKSVSGDWAKSSFSTRPVTCKMRPTGHSTATRLLPRSPDGASIAAGGHPVRPSLARHVW